MITNNISTLEMTHDEWLKRRFESIGASESGSILGINPYKTAVDVYYEKVDKVTDFPDNLNMWLGRELEPVIKKRFEEESGFKVRNDHKIRVDKEHSFMTTNLDGMVVGEKVHVEYKALGRWDGDIPDYYFSQVQHQIMVLDSEYAYFVVLVLSAQKSFIIQKINRDDEFIKLMRSEEISFWQENVQTNTPPDPETIDDARKIYSDSIQGSSFETSSPHIINKVNLLIETKAEIKEKQDVRDNIQKELMEAMQDNESLVNQDTGHTLCTWKKSNDQLRFDAKRLKEENPEIYTKYMKQTTGTRRFLIKGGQNG
tara:strand:+ start:895 stop:1833 length:939 start_codon:yes stop_codon:yes gene_type:complete